MILENVVEQLAFERGCHVFNDIPVEDSTGLPPFAENAQRQLDLRNMCLVHRRWTPHAQRVLQRDVYIYGQINLRLFLQSPSLVPSVKDLHYAPFPPFMRSDRPKDSERETFDLLALLLERIPNLRNFHLYTRFASLVHISRITRVVKKLEGLHAITSGRALKDFERQRRNGSGLCTRAIGTT